MKMSVTKDLLEVLKASQGGCSDYKLAQLLCVAQQTISKYQKDQCPISAEKIILACDIAGEDPIKWLLLLQAERARCTAEKEIWNDLLTRIAA
jgi:transcriptional regulator with XRE-family HTH domain